MISPTSNALSTVARTKAAGFGSAASDDSLQMAINAVSAAFERICGRTFGERVYSFSPTSGQKPAELVAGSGRRFLLLSTYPILSVQEVRVDGAVITDWLLGQDAEWGAIFRANGWPRSEGSWGHLVSEPDGDPLPNVQVAYRGGFPETPADLELALMREVDLLTSGDASKSIMSERTPGGWSVTYGGKSHAFSLDTECVLNGYIRRFV